MKTRQAIPIQEIGWIGARSQLANFYKGIPGGISTMWIGTVGTLPAKSQLTRAAQYPIIMPHSHRFMLHSPVQPTADPDLLRHLRLHRGAKYIHSPHPDRVRDPAI
ncbi:hypothetical protein BASA83_001187 [Batrachochytrium salamandrivorans]|nr:hypothetical protein BASA62_003059 [Batrachochytrium salamandrivorans]KAH9276486.1 hypothetical protein BASA83_001187 [Batrachochytrium salamandrivorans]